MQGGKESWVEDFLSRIRDLQTTMSHNNSNAYEIKCLTRPPLDFQRRAINHNTFSEMLSTQICPLHLDHEPASRRPEVCRILVSKPAWHSRILTNVDKLLVLLWFPVWENGKINMESSGLRFTLLLAWFALASTIIGSESSGKTSDERALRTRLVWGEGRFLKITGSGACWYSLIAKTLWTSAKCWIESERLWSAHHRLSLATPCKNAAATSR